MNEFRRKLLKIDQPRHHEIKNSLGTEMAYKWSKKNNLIPKISLKLYTKIVREVNQALIDKFLRTGEMMFPKGMGKAVLNKLPTKTYFENGKLVTNMTVDWDATIKLWEEDEEARTNKTLIRVIRKYNYYIDYIKKWTHYKNKYFYMIRFSRKLWAAVRDHIENGTLDAF